MYQMKMNGHIDHMVASFYIKSGNGWSSSVKFGSYDTAGIIPGETLRMYKTKSLASWMINARNIALNGLALTDDGSTRYLNLDMQLPYLYLPDHDFMSF